jgi:hypothetical protein
MVSRARDFPRAAFDRTWYSLTEQSEAPNIPLSGVLRLYKAVGARGEAGAAGVDSPGGT